MAGVLRRLAGGCAEPLERAEGKGNQRGACACVGKTWVKLMILAVILLTLAIAKKNPNSVSLLYTDYMPVTNKHSNNLFFTLLLAFFLVFFLQPCVRLSYNNPEKSPENLSRYVPLPGLICVLGPIGQYNHVKKSVDLLNKFSRKLVGKNRKN